VHEAVRFTSRSRRVNVQRNVACMCERFILFERSVYANKTRLNRTRDSVGFTIGLVHHSRFKLLVFIWSQFPSNITRYQIALDVVLQLRNNSVFKYYSPHIAPRERAHVRRAADKRPLGAAAIFSVFRCGEFSPRVFTAPLAARFLRPAETGHSYVLLLSNRRAT